MRSTIENEPDEQGPGFLAAVIASSEDAIVSKTLAGIVTSWNRAAERIFGYTALEMIGHPISILTVPDRVDELPLSLDRIRRGDRIECYETKRRRKDGQIIDVSLSISPIRGADESIIGAAKIARDITAAKGEHAALAEREAHLRSIFDAVPDGMIVIDERGIVQSFSAAAERIFGYRAAEICGRNVNLLMPSPYREAHDDYIAGYLATGEAHIIQDEFQNTYQRLQSPD